MKVEKKRLLARVAYLYYVEDKSQAQIAEELGIYRTTISRMLERAKREGIVQISIKEFNQDLFALEEYLRKKYGLKQVELIEVSQGATKDEKLEEIASAAAEMIRGIVRSGDVVGLSWGSTLSRTIDKIGYKSLQGVLVCPLAGGPSHINSRFHVNSLVYRLSQAFHSQNIFINSIAVQETSELAEGIRFSKYFEELREAWHKIDVAIVGIGGQLTPSEDSQWRDLLTAADYQVLLDNHAVGEICCRFFDENGSPVHKELQERTIGIELGGLARIPKTIGIAYGDQKVAALLAAIRQGYINHLVTDKETAMKMLWLDHDKFEFSEE